VDGWCRPPIPHSLPASAGDPDPNAVGVVAVLMDFELQGGTWGPVLDNGVPVLEVGQNGTTHTNVHPASGGMRLGDTWRHAEGQAALQAVARRNRVPVPGSGADYPIASGGTQGGRGIMVGDVKACVEACRALGLARVRSAVGYDELYVMDGVYFYRFDLNSSSPQTQEGELIEDAQLIQELESLVSGVVSALGILSRTTTNSERPSRSLRQIWTRPSWR